MEPDGELVSSVGVGHFVGVCKMHLLVAPSDPTPPPSARPSSTVRPVAVAFTASSRIEAFSSRPPDRRLMGVAYPPPTAQIKFGGGF